MNLNSSFVKTLLVFVTLLCQNTLYAQTPVLLGQDTQRRVINTAVPFLNLAPDARAAGMGDVGAATSPDANSAHWNPAKLAFVDKDFGFSLSYTPWLRNIVSDMSISYLSGYYKIDELQTFGMSLRYFNLGSIQFTDGIGLAIRDFNPRELAVDVTYARKLSDRLSVAVTGRFIHSNLSADLILSNQTETKPGNSGAADVSLYYNSDRLDFFGLNSKVSLGANISNIGAKISYSNNQERDFLPTNLRLGGALKMELDEFNTFTFAADINKLLVPTPPQIDAQGNIIKGRNPRETSLLSGMFGSFGDAPGGFREELQEFSLGTGVEYAYKDLFSARAGYFTEHVNKGNRKYFSVGAGMYYNAFGLDIAYLIPMGQVNALGETLRFTLLFNFDK